MAAYGQFSFDGHFDTVTGTSITVDITFEVPVDFIFTRVSVFTNNATAIDASLSVFKNDGSQPSDHIVDPGVLAAFTNQLNGVDIADLPAYQGETITVRLNIVSPNTLQKVKWVLGCAAQVAPLAA